MTELEQLMDGVLANVGSFNNLIGAAVLAACLAVAWLVARRLRARVSQREHHRWAFGEGGFDRVAFPLLALVFVWVAKLVLRRFDLEEATPLLRLANTLLVAMAVIRFFVYVMRSVMPNGGLLRVSERTLAWTMWIGVVLYLTGLLPEIASALDDIAFTLGKQRISLLLVIQAVVSVAVTLAIAMWIASLVEGRVLKAERMQMSTRVVLAKLVRTLAFLAAILIALPLVGIDLTVLSVFGGALGVGLGFGLQKIASNYVSGFIILLDRSVRIGDLITVDGRHGTIQEIASRYTVVRSGDGTESIIPNDTLITQSVTNHSYSDKKAVVKVSIVVGYDADIDRVFEIMQGAGKGHPRVLPEPVPVATILRIGDAGVEVELAAWIDDAHAGQQEIRSDLLKATLKGLREHGIGIPAPRREITFPATAETK
jgi:small-conductance mechanosensitive channel